MKILWLDLETTGLDPSEDWPLEISATLMNTDGDVLETYDAVLGLNRKAFERIHKKENEWALKTHLKSGLLAECMDSKMEACDVEVELCGLVYGHIEKGEKVVLAGNSVHFDMNFLKAYFPDIYKILHYHLLDITVMRTMVEALGLSPPFQSNAQHRSRADVERSIDNFTYWKPKFLEMGLYDPRKDEYSDE